MGCDFSPPTTIIGDCSARIPMPELDRDSGPNGSCGLDATGFGGGASFREICASEPPSSGASATAGTGRVSRSTSISIGSSPLPSPVAAAFSVSWGSSIVMES
jgi:hypothetical protein